MLAICPGGEGLPAAGVVYAGFTLVSKAYEPAGRAFQAAAAVLLGLEVEAEEDGPEPEIDLGKLRGKRRRLAGVAKEDLYEVLELQEERALITELRVRECYRRLVLLYHPDKYAEGEYTPQAKEKWLKVP